MGLQPLFFVILAVACSFSSGSNNTVTFYDGLLLGMVIFYHGSLVNPQNTYITQTKLIIHKQHLYNTHKTYKTQTKLI